MFRKVLIAAGILSALGVFVATSGILQVSAHCGKCLTDAKHFAGSLDKSKMTLSAAATIAEVETKGTAVHATTQRLKEGVNVEVHCLVDGNIMAVVVDGQTGKVLRKKQVKDLEAHASE